jgi:hypothetical protein
MAGIRVSGAKVPPNRPKRPWESGREAALSKAASMIGVIFDRLMEALLSFELKIFQ